MIRLILILSSAGLLAACSSGSGPAPDQAKGPRAATFVTVADRQLASGVTASGKLTSREETAVAPQISGYQIARVLVDQGDWVKQGQVLALLDDTLLRADIAQQQAAVAQARIAAEQADQEAARVAGLDNSGVLSAEAIAQRRLAAKTAHAQLGQATALLDAQQVKERLMAVRAPLSGQILSRAARPGDVAATGSILFRLARGGEVELDAEVPEQDIARLHKGDRAQVKLADGTIVPGVVRLVGAEIDADTRLGHVRVTLPVRKDVLAGGFADASFAPTGGTVHTVRETAVHYSASGATLTTIGKSNIVATVPVTLGRRGGGYVELVSGPSPGTRALLGAQDFVLDGDKVQAVAASAEAR